MNNDRLSVDIAAEIAALQASTEALPTESGNTVTDQPILEDDVAIPAIESDIEVEDSSFFNAPKDDFEFEGEEELELTSEQPNELKAPEPAPQSISYKANGKETTLTWEEAQKRLSLYDGSRKAYQDKANLQKELSAAHKEVAEYKRTWDELEGFKDDMPRLIQTLSGKDYGTFLEGELQKREAYKTASPAEQRAMDSEERLVRLEKDRSSDLRKSEQKAALAEERATAVEKEVIKTTMENAFRTQLEGLDLSPNLQKMFWRNAKEELKEYTDKGYPPNYKNGALIRKVFTETAAEFKDFTKAKAKEELSEVIDKHSKDSIKHAQLDARKGQSRKVASSDLMKMDPSTLFNRLFKGR